MMQVHGAAPSAETRMRRARGAIWAEVGANESVRRWAGADGRTRKMRASRRAGVVAWCPAMARGARQCSLHWRAACQRGVRALCARVHKA